MIKDLITDPNHPSYRDHHRCLARLINQYRDAVVRQTVADMKGYEGLYLFHEALAEVLKIEKDIDWHIDAIDHGFYGD